MAVTSMGCRLMEHADGIAIGVKQKLSECHIAGRETEIENLTSNFRVVLLLLDAIYPLLLTKYGMATPEILRELDELLELLRRQWVNMRLPMTPLPTSPCRAANKDNWRRPWRSS
jgi:hypothetical protein